MTKIYSYDEPGRRPTVYLGTVVFAVVLVGAFYNAAPWFFYLPLLGGGAMLLYMLVKNPVSGVTLYKDRLVLSPLLHPNSIPLSDIERIEIISWSDSTDMKVHLKSGDSISAFSGDIPPRAPFAKALAQVGIPLEFA